MHSISTGQNSDFDSQFTELLLRLHPASQYVESPIYELPVTYSKSCSMILQMLIKDAGSAGQLSPLSSPPSQSGLTTADEPVIFHADQIDLLSVSSKSIALLLPSTKAQPTMKPAIGRLVCAPPYHGRYSPQLCISMIPQG
jgi:hypothetical protein